MGRYGNGISIKDVCGNMAYEASEIMRDYGVEREARKNIIGMIKEAWYQCEQANRCARVLEKKLEEMGVNTANLIIESFK